MLSMQNTIKKVSNYYLCSSNTKFIEEENKRDKEHHSNSVPNGHSSISPSQVLDVHN